ncbi:MAG: hypothetical protein ACYDA4_04175 [Ignavibacteriaceae bacterium]
MNLKSKEVKRSVRDFGTICRDLSNASGENYLSIIRRLMSFITSNQVISKIVDPLFNMQIESAKYLRDLGNGWGELIVPDDLTLHMALTLQLFRDFINDPTFELYSFVIHYYRSTDIHENLYNFHNQIVGPALREIITKTEDYIDDELEGKEEVELGSIQVFAIGAIHNQSGNIAIGNNINISQVSNLDMLPDEFAKAILQNGFTLSQFDKLRTGIEELKSELKKAIPEESKIKSIFNKVLAVGGNAMLEILVNLISKPEITTGIIKSIL